MSSRSVRAVTLAALAAAALLASVRPALAQTRATPAEPIAVPRVKDYEATAELRDIYFAVGKATITPEAEKILDANAVWLRMHPDRLVLIEGHCDDRGPAGNKNEFNMALGEARAQAAMDHLVARGVHPSRITVLSYGEERPRCAEQDERCWRQNRRSRFLVKPR